MTEKELRRLFAKTAESFDGTAEGSLAHHGIVDIYNSHNPLARGYKLKYSDSWCAGFVSAIAIKTGLTDIVPTEVGCGAMISLYQKMGRWEESDGYVPEPGDVIFYDWDDSAIGDNKNSPDHVGIVCYVDHGVITVIEGNKSNRVGYRNIGVDGRFIRGYGLPDFAGIADVPAALDYDKTASEVIGGKWGNGQERKDRLTAAGYDYNEVQKIVNKLLSGSNPSDDDKLKAAKAVIRGEYGNGEDRKKRLEADGFNYNEIQKIVNKELRG